MYSTHNNISNDNNNNIHYYKMNLSLDESMPICLVLSLIFQLAMLKNNKMT